MHALDRVLLVLSLAAAIAACGSPQPDDMRRAECERLRDHLVELRLETVTEEHDRFRESIRASLSHVVTSCLESMSASQLRCSLAAADFDALTACGEAGAS